MRAELQPQRKTYIIGSNGNLALSLKKSIPAAIVVPRSEYMKWSKSSDLETLIAKRNSDIYVAIGVLSKDADMRTLNHVNIEIPKLIAQGIIGTSSRVITYGSIMEKHPGIVSTNPYIASKKYLSEYLIKNVDYLSFLHLRMHTLYGGERIHPHMFLGQLFNSVSTSSKFSMSSGAQLREYHHIEDDLLAGSELLSKNFLGVQEVSHGELLTLKQVATAVLSHFHKSGLLDYGKLDSPDCEVFESLSELNPALRDINFRKTIPGIIEYFSEQLDRPRK
jgi:hypothetical protein